MFAVSFATTTDAVNAFSQSGLQERYITLATARNIAIRSYFEFVLLI
jgi:hypothetical protein